MKLDFGHFTAAKYEKLKVGNTEHTKKHNIYLHFIYVQIYFLGLFWRPLVLCFDIDGSELLATTCS